MKKVLARLMRLLDAPWVTRRRRNRDLLPEQTQRDIEYYNSRGGL